MRKSPVPFVLCALVVLAPLVGCQKIQARADFKRGNKFYKDENYKAALSEFQNGLRLDPNADFAWRSVGLSAMALFRPGDKSPDNLKFADTAVDAFQKYLKFKPQDSRTEEYLVGLWVNAEQYDKAIDYLKKQRQAHPEDTKLNQGIVSVMIKALRFKDALDWANDHARKDAQLYYQVGTQAWSKSYNDPTVTLDDRIKIVDIGLDAMQRAVEERPDYMEAMVYYNLLYREKAKLTLDPKVKDQLLAKADEWRTKALELKDRQKQKPPTPQPSAAKTS